MPGHELPLLTVDLSETPARSAPERAIATRNRERLLDAARQLLDEVGPEAMSMDAVATAAGVGKGTLFRRFGSRTGLLLALLDHEERAQQQEFMFGPPPLGPDAPPLERLIALGRSRVPFIERHLELARASTVDCERAYFSPPAQILRTHIRSLLAEIKCAGNLDTQTYLLMSLLSPAYIYVATRHHLQSPRQLGDAWEHVVRKLCAP